nr:PREDICTED: lanC-like protein 2 [Latimeria chalumnae]|eukprot:XP_006012867.2 PREDICTED: lanC-like protein 2 [Latimeria chalumnae]
MQPTVLGVEAFSAKWPKGLLYAFSPLPLLSQVILKLRKEGRQMILIAPHWLHQVWFSDMLDLQSELAIPLPFCDDILSQNEGQILHLNLHTWLLRKDLDLVGKCPLGLLQLHRTVVSSNSDLPDELLYGRAGYLYALLYVNVEIGPDTVPQSDIKESTAKVDQEILTELVKPSVDYVRHKKFRSGNYPSSLSNETDRLVHWCHGAPGVIHMLIQSYKTFKEEKYLKDALECSDVIWQRGLLRKGYGICHGTSGNGYSFLSLYHLTQDKKYLFRACKFAEWCLDYGAHGCRIPDRPYSLFEGMAGAIYFLSDMLNPETSHFPGFEL